MSDLKAKSVEGDFICDLGISILGFAICNLICVIEILSRAELLLLGSRCVALLCCRAELKVCLNLDFVGLMGLSDERFLGGGFI